ncbi:MAG: glycosyltransferase family 2 protein [Solirubrobacteraceae bacterium]
MAPTEDPRISVIIRARDEAASIGRCLALLGAQELGDTGIRPEVIVVDSGSRDATAVLAARAGARVIAMPAREFTFGGALNLGAAEARGALLVSLSAHAFPRDQRWLARLVGAFEDPRVACASGERWRPDGAPLSQPAKLDSAEFEAAGGAWGYSNAAGGFRAELWRRRAFREDLPGCEDLEWCGHWLAQGYSCVLDPALLVEHDHTHDPLPSIYLRARREAEGIALLRPPTAAGGARALVGEWWKDLRFYESPLRARLSHRRAARLLGGYRGRRRALRARSGR